MDTTMKILEWNMKAPLEIIYEAYEGEEEDEVNNDNNMVSNDKEIVGCERYPSLSLYYPESDSSWDGDFPMDLHSTVCQWTQVENKTILREDMYVYDDVYNSTGVVLPPKEIKASILKLKIVK
ncbi:hypothetical protein Tco_1466868 [Tanacetum coccineum]